MKKYISILLTVIALSLLAGCSGREEKVLEATESQISEKYNITFCGSEALRSENGWWVWLRPEGSDIVTKAEVNEDLVLESDNYPIKKICNDLTLQANTLMSEYKDCYVHADNISEFCFSDTADITVDEYLKQNPADRIQIGIIAKDDADISALYKAVKNVWENINIRTGYINVFLVPEKLEKIEKETKHYDDIGYTPVQEMLDKGTRQFIKIDGRFPSESEFASGFRSEFASGFSKTGI